jgi:hypothetical protein
VSATLKLKEITRLLHNTPSPAHADANARLTEFIAQVEPYELRHIQRAVTMILGDQVPELDNRFPIFPGALVHVVKDLAGREAAGNRLHRGAMLQIMDRSREFHRDPPDVRRAAVAAGLARLEGLRGESPEQIREHEEANTRYLAKHDRAFATDQAGEEMRKRLKI